MTIQVKRKLVGEPGYESFRHYLYYHQYDEIGEAMDEFVSKQLLTGVELRKEFDGWGLIRSDGKEYTFENPEGELEDGEEEDEE